MTNSSDKHLALSTDTSQLNKSWLASVLDIFYIGKILEVKFKGEKLGSIISNSIKYTMSDQAVQNLESTEISFIEDFCHKDGKLFEIYKVIIPNLYGESNQTIDNFNSKLTSLLHTLEQFKVIELFWYDRKEIISDFDYYFEQLDKVRQKNKYYDNRGEKLSNEIRKNLNTDLQNMINQTKSRTRECFIIISEDCEILEDLATSIKSLGVKKTKIETSFDDIKIKFLKLEGRNRDWLFNNFVSHKSHY
jgi:hypothetical protein